MQTGAIYCGDAARVLQQHLPEGVVDLIYVDPPFFSDRTYEVVWGNGYELKAYEDRWRGGIENYIAWMEPKVREMHRVLKPTGTLYLHCDWHASGHLRLLLDHIFGAKRFMNEVIWWYHDPAGTVRDRFKKKHDTIFVYAKEMGKQFFDTDAVRTPYREGTLEQGRKGYRSFGRATRTHPLGKIREDVWEIPFINSQSKERLGYPTQKPEALIDVVVKASSAQGAIVLDPMMGGGTTLAVAQRLGRRWIGADISPLACQMAQRRLRKIGATPVMIGMPMSVQQLKALTPFAFQNWVVEKLYGHPSAKKVGDFGIDGWLLDGRPVQVKQSEHVSRPVVDEFESALQRVKKTAGVIVGFSFTRGCHEEVARAKNEQGLEIELKTVTDILTEMGVHETELECLDFEEE